MANTVNSPRRYSSPVRAGQAAVTREQILGAARGLFTTQGYLATKVSEIAATAGVSVDTVYATIGRKPVLMREVVESAISGTDHAVPAEQRDYVVRVRAATTAASKMQIYAEAVAAMSPRTAPVFMALRDAAHSDADCAALDKEISDRRANNMRLFAADLRTTQEIRCDLTDDYIADVVWATAGAEHYIQLVSARGWAPEQFGAHLTELWKRLFISG